MHLDAHGRIVLTRQEAEIARRDPAGHYIVRVEEEAP
jgi:hypothetical protein